MQSERRWRRLIFRWTVPKGFTATASFLMLAILIEYLVVHFFLSFGLTDKFSLTKTLQVPLTSLFFTITISPLFHFIPLGVITVLVSSWTYLTKYVAMVPRGVKPAKKPFKARRRRYALQRLFFARASVKSTAITLGVFSVSVFGPYVLGTALRALGAPITGPMAKLDLVVKYVVCQNIATWASAVTALAYGRYASRLHRRRKP